MNNTEVMRRYRSPVCRADVERFIRQYEPAGGQVVTASGENPFCGDSLRMAAWLKPDGEIGDICYEGYGCSLCIASAEFLLEQMKTRKRSDGRLLNTAEILQGLGQIQVGRSRIHCVELPLHTLQKMLDTANE